ncbi:MULTISPECIES: hypothetical protein [unclassified Crossiella]|uniref:hypothetical protein n=1 Tax=unclassified Crossiella TaxID=2620835 RepID=UPI0020002722|nr:MULTISPECIES: hypothetical protein [unclassified Crossiella]MCK2243200.1 hypothetical protein [Crossiella sp. S99.2]MCK2254331.1 hypothetical protein [Crossiella sp. S99.1]
MRWLPIVLVCVFAGGCGAFGTPPRPSTVPPPTRTVGTPLPVEITGPQPEVRGYGTDHETEPPLAPSASLLDRMLGNIRLSTLRSAGAPGTITASCEGDVIRTEPGAVTRCTGTYNGVAVPWTIRANARSGGLTEFVSLPERTLLTNKVIYQEFFQRNQPSENLRCQAIPEVVLVHKPIPGSTTEIDTGFRCQVLYSGQDARVWTEQRLFMNSMGMVWKP